MTHGNTSRVVEDYLNQMAKDASVKLLLDPETAAPAFQEPLSYTVPRLKSLACEFAKQAEISTDGKTVRVGRYRAERIGPIIRLLLLGNLNPKLGGGAYWTISRQEKPSLRFSFNRYGFTDPKNMPGVIAELALMEASQHITPEDKKEALKLALNKLQ